MVILWWFYGDFMVMVYGDFNGDLMVIVWWLYGDLMVVLIMVI